MLQSYESCFVQENVLRTWKDVDLGDDGTARTIADSSSAARVNNKLVEFHLEREAVVALEL